MKRSLRQAEHFVHARMLTFLLGLYLLAGLLPGPGLSIRSIRFAEGYSLPSILLAFLLFSAGFGMRLPELRHLARRPAPLLAGTVANLVLLPALVMGFAALLNTLWHDPVETAATLTGLAFVASMPVAGSSATWTQGAGGSLALSLGLVILSTALSPLTTPVIFKLAAGFTYGDYAADLRELAASGAGGFLLFSVLVPTVLGMAARALVPARSREGVRDVLKSLALLDLLLLNYTNACTALPELLQAPDWDFLALLLAASALLCGFGFTVGGWMGRRLGANPGERTALMYGLGMSNNGTALVLVTTAMADHPDVALPILLYNLAQQAVAAAVAQRQRRPE